MYRLLGFTAAVRLRRILFGTAPAWRANAIPLNAAMKEVRGVLTQRAPHGSDLQGAGGLADRVCTRAG